MSGASLQLLTSIFKTRNRVTTSKSGIQYLELPHDGSRGHLKQKRNFVDNLSNCGLLFLTFIYSEF